MVTLVKNMTAKAGNIRDTVLTPGSGRSSGQGNGNPLQYSCLENPMDRGACRVQSMVVWGWGAGGGGCECHKELDMTEET